MFVAVGLSSYPEFISLALRFAPGDLGCLCAVPRSGASVSNGVRICKYSCPRLPRSLLARQNVDTIRVLGILGGASSMGGPGAEPFPRGPQGEFGGPLGPPRRAEATSLDSYRVRGYPIDLLKSHGSVLPLSATSASLSEVVPGDVGRR